MIIAGAGCAQGRAALGPPIAAAAADPGLMRVQRAVWDAWYAGDTALVRALTPALVTINPGGGSSDFGDQEHAIQASARFHAGGGRLVSLDFPAMKVQILGADVAVIYSTYRSVAVMGNDTMRTNGRATEVFVRQNGRWVNPGWHLDSGN